MNTNDKHGWLLKMVQENAVKIILGLAITAIANLFIMFGNLWLTSKLSPLQSSINSLTVRAEKNKEDHEKYEEVIDQLVKDHTTFQESFKGYQTQVTTMQGQIQSLYTHFLK